VILRSRAPVRIDFAGGWTDVAQFCRETKGKVLNAAINKYSYVTLFEKDHTEEIEIESADYHTFIEALDIKQIEYDGNIDLLKAAVKLYSSRGGFKLITQSNAPAGSGLGTSASMGVALVGLISRYSGNIMLPYEIAEAASMIERNELDIRGGKQDHYASALGGISFMEFHEENVQSSPIRLKREILMELEKNLVICYTGQSRLSGDIHKDVASNFSNKEMDTVGSIEKLKEIAESMKNALLNGNLHEFAGLLNQNWECQKKLHPSVMNNEIEKLFDIALKNGAVGGKAAGAGGGGCIIFYCERNKDHKVIEKLKESGATIIDFNFDFDGYQYWEVPEIEN